MQFYFNQVLCFTKLQHQTHILGNCSTVHLLELLEVEVVDLPNFSALSLVCSFVIAYSEPQC